MRRSYFLFYIRLSNSCKYKSSYTQDIFPQIKIKILDAICSICIMECFSIRISVHNKTARKQHHIFLYFYQTWFIRDLMCLVISFPLFYYGYKFLGKYLALLILGSFLLYVGPSMETRFILIPIFFWGFGMYCGMRRYELDSIDNYIKLSICFIALILLFIELIFNGQIAMILDNTFLVFGSFAIIILGHYIVKYTSFRFTEILTASSFFIFCCHKLGPTYIAKSGIRFITMDPVQEQIIVFLICPFISVLICILIYRFGKKSFPQLLNILTGGK